jgi:hypothetical protein
VPPTLRSRPYASRCRLRTMWTITTQDRPRIIRPPTPLQVSCAATPRSDAWRSVTGRPQTRPADPTRNGQRAMGCSTGP